MSKAYSVRRPFLAFMSGAVVGILGGLIGLGGAEFRLPILITLFALYPHRAVRFNLLVSFITLLFAAATRLGFQTGAELSAYADVACAMIAGGMIAALIGASKLARLSSDRLMRITSALLLLIAALLLAEVALQDAVLPSVPDNTMLRAALGVVAGLGIGAVSSLLGVAGGEFIIPVLMFGFGADIKTAGTLSLIISLPIVAAGVIKHRRTGYYRSADVLTYLVLPMGAGSIVGALAGGVLSAHFVPHGIKALLAIVLAVSSAKLWRTHKARTGAP